MPDIVTHYAFSLLLSSRFMGIKRALLIAFIGVLPDIDVVFRVHRSITHSLIITAIPFLLTLITARLAKPGLAGFVIVGMTLYELHILMDIFIAPTPIMWPLVNASLTLNMEIYATLNSQGIELAPRLTLASTPCDFSQRALLGGTLVSTTGVIALLFTCLTLLAERLLTGKQRN